jgi:hypothetical protein
MTQPISYGERLIFMEESALVKAINKLWAAKVIKYDFDINDMKISFELSIVEKDKEIIYELEFYDVKSFYYLNSSKTPRSLIPWENIELTEIHYITEFDEIIYTSKNKKTITKISSNPNFYLELWSDVLLIEAGKIKIDGNEFELCIR